MTHEYKVWPRFFDAIQRGAKPFDVRRVDPSRHDVTVGDSVRFREWEPDIARGVYTGNSCMKRVTYVLHGDGVLLPYGWMVMGLAEPPAGEGSR